MFAFVRPRAGSLVLNVRCARCFVLNTRESAWASPRSRGATVWPGIITSSCNKQCQGGHVGTRRMWRFVRTPYTCDRRVLTRTALHAARCSVDWGPSLRCSHMLTSTFMSCRIPAATYAHGVPPGTYSMALRYLPQPHPLHTPVRTRTPFLFVVYIVLS